VFVAVGVDSAASCASVKGTAIVTPWSVMMVVRGVAGGQDVLLQSRPTRQQPGLDPDPDPGAGEARQA